MKVYILNFKIYKILGWGLRRLLYIILLRTLGCGQYCFYNGHGYINLPKSFQFLLSGTVTVFRALFASRQSFSLQFSLSHIIGVAFEVDTASCDTCFCIHLLGLLLVCLWATVRHYIYACQQVPVFE